MGWLKDVLAFLIGIFLAGAAAAQEAPQVDPALVEARNFPVVVELVEVPAVNDDEALYAVLQDRRERIDAEMVHCEVEPERLGLCRAEALGWDADEMTAARGAVLEALDGADALSRFAAQLRGSGDFAFYHDLSDQALVSRALEDALAGHNLLIDIYALGADPRYPAVDAIIQDPSGEVWNNLMIDATDLILERAQAMGGLRGDPAHLFVLNLLYLNERENAGSFPDLHRDQNGPAATRVGGTDWDAYPYSVLLVLGDGPDMDGQRVGAFGKLRLARAAQLYRAGVAPFVVVSGGNVHPAFTTINEAEEMKHELVSRHGIPADVIFMEPYARHTTTNFRNTVRLMLEYGIPLDRTALVTTSRTHSDYAGGEQLVGRNTEELGYQPMQAGRRLSTYEFEWAPNPASTHRDVRDPLDP